MKTFFEKTKNASKANKKLFSRIELIQNITEDIMIAMEDLNISKSDLAKKIGKSKSYVSQLLSGSRNMTLASLSDLCFELDIIPEVTILEKKQAIEVKHIQEMSLNWEKAELMPSLTKNSRKICLRVMAIDSHPNYQYTKTAA